MLKLRKITTAALLAVAGTPVVLEGFYIVERVIKYTNRYGVDFKVFLYVAVATALFYSIYKVQR